MVGERSRGLDEATIRDFIERDYPRLVAAVTLGCGSWAAAEDAVQEALSRAWERSERGERIDSLVAWVTRVALNLSRSWLRRVRAERQARERMRAALPTDDFDELVVDVQRAIARLPRRQREATVLRYFLGLDVREIATALGLSEGTIKTTLFRARQALARALQPEQTNEETDVAKA